MTSREMEVEIATKIFGWEFGTKEKFHPTWSGDPGECWWTPAVRDLGRIPFSHPPEYCTDVRASKALREKLAETHPTYNLIRKDEFGKFQFCWYDSPEWFQGPWAETEELAVALCALRSVGIQ